MHSKDLSSLLVELSSTPVSVIDAQIPHSAYTPIQISSLNLDLNTFDITLSKAWETYLKSYLKKRNKKVAFGGYLEERNIYKRSKTFNQNNPETERNIHLGVDLWVDSETSVLAAFDGEIHSFKDNDSYGNYGPTIILKHTINAVEFYTLYGHLSRESLNAINVGQRVFQGETIAQLGTAKVNGDYAPHLHFQIIKDIQDYYGDYPGVASKKDIDFYRNNCPNPLIILGF